MDLTLVTADGRCETRGETPDREGRGEISGEGPDRGRVARGARAGSPLPTFLPSPLSIWRLPSFLPSHDCSAKKDEKLHPLGWSFRQKENEEEFLKPCRMYEALTLLPPSRRAGM